jgi:2-keto-4-pentenoate hydratase/2-oxohepta-3-ene-1,7-dioic acid hydratase in catechol pathway
VGRVDFEGELAVVVGKLVRRLEPADAIQAVLGFTCANDVTARDLQNADGQWTRAKGFDTFCPLGPWIETDLDSSDLALDTLVNGEARQQARTSQLEHGVAELLAFVSRVMTLLPGDVLLTGTPAGVGPLEPGDRVEVEVEGVGVLANEVVAEPSRG